MKDWLSSPIIRYKTKMSTLTMPIQHLLEGPANTVSQEKEVKRIRKEKNKTIFINTTVYTENPEESTKDLIELMDEFSKVTGWKTNIQKLYCYILANE